MQEGTGVGKETWWKYLAVALGYGGGVWLFQYLNLPHFVLLCGVHFIALLLMPYRYWPVMILADVLVQMPIAIECVSSFGMAWSLLRLVPSTLLSGPIVYVFRERYGVVSPRAASNTRMLLVCALLVSVVLTGLNEMQIAVAVYPVGVKPPQYDHLAAQWLLGNFLGILTVVPAALSVWEAVCKQGWRGLLTMLAESRAVFESVCFVVPGLVLLLWVGFAEPHWRGIAQAAMFMPVVWLALRHGRQGAAWGGTAASLALVWLMPEKFDRVTIQAEVIVAFVICTMLLVGERVESLDRKAEKERQDMRAALAIAQRNVHLGELQLRTSAQALEQARETVRSGFSMMLGRLRHLQPAIDDGGYQRVAVAVQDQLFGISDSMHPVMWRERGLPAVLREGTVARMLDGAGIRYWCEYRGPVSALSSAVHLTIYRMVCEAVAEGCMKRDVSDVCVRIRAGDRNGRRWVAVSVLFQGNRVRLPHVKWDDLLPRLVRVTTGMGIKAIQDRAAAFEGYAHERTRQQGRSVGWLMLDL